MVAVFVVDVAVFVVVVAVFVVDVVLVVVVMFTSIHSPRQPDTNYGKRYSLYVNLLCLLLDDDVSKYSQIYIVL